MTWEGLTIACERTARGVSVRLRGALDAVNVSHVAAALADLIDHSEGDIELDLGGIDRVDLAGVRLLFELSRGMDATHRRLSLVHPTVLFSRDVQLLEQIPTTSVTAPCQIGRHRPRPSDPGPAQSSDHAPAALAV